MCSFAHGSLKKADLCFIPSDACRKIALRRGLSPSQLRQHGLPLRRGFWQPETRPKDSVRKSLGLSPNQRTTLVVGGGDGIGGITGVADALGHSLGACSSCGEVWLRGWAYGLRKRGKTIKNFKKKKREMN